MSKKRLHNPDDPSQLMLIHGEVAGDNKQLLFDVYGESLHQSDRIIYPEANSTDKVIDKVAQFRLAGSDIALVDGSFDVPHPNHEWYLRHCRLMAAQQMLYSKGETISADSLQVAVESDAVRLIVTLDADMRIAQLKGGAAAKGGAQRPIYPWKTRADRLAGYMFKGQSGQYRQVVDLVTVEGDEKHVGTPLESSLSLARYLAENDLLDSLVMYGEHSSTIEEARKMYIAPIVITDGLVYESNPLTGRDWKSSDIIRRARGEKPLARIALQQSKPEEVT